MNRKEQQGIAFGFALALTWLILLTGFIMYDKMKVGNDTNKDVIVLPPNIEIIGEFDYE